MITNEMLEKANEQIKKIDFKGKPYALVSERVKAFRTMCPNGTIKTEIVNISNAGEKNEVVTIRATIEDAGKIIATGTAQETKGAGYVNGTSHIENCETSAIGRALGFVGLGADNISSADELVNALKQQNKMQEVKPGQDIAVEYATEEQINAIKKSCDGLGNEVKKKLLREFEIKRIDNLPKSKVQTFLKKVEAIKKAQEVKNG